MLQLSQCIEGRAQEPQHRYDAGSQRHAALGIAHNLQQLGVQYRRWECTVKGGREGRDIDAVELAQAVEALGAGEILLNCIDKDGQ